MISRIPTKPFRSITRFLSRAKRSLLALFVIWNLLDVLNVQRHLQNTQTVDPDLHNRPRAEKIYIASNFWNSEAALRNYWMDAVMRLAEHLGPDNVFISAVESGSYDNTKDALRSLADDLSKFGVPGNVVLDENSHADKIGQPPEPEGWITTPNGTVVPRRIPYLSRQRNAALDPLHEMALEGKKYDKILFLNDVAFTIEDFEMLLHTNKGEYAAACSLDFSKPPQFYDTFVMRDSEGHESLMQTWPYFRSRRSRSAMKRSESVEVVSCWNGMVIMDAAPFYADLQFRGIPDTLAESHLEGSECCLIHIDNRLSSSKGVWVNPNVRVGYSAAAYEKVQHEAYYRWLTPFRIFCKLWENRLRRWFTTTWFKESLVGRKLAAWTSKGHGRMERGKACLINEMHILTWYGWAHV